MPVTNLLIDLDGTVYPQENGIWEEIAARMEQFMHKELQLPLADIPTLRQQYYAQYGTTLSGLRRNFHVNELDYLDYVHNIPLQDYLQPDPKLRATLQQLPQKKWIFTNSDRAHSERVLNALGILDQFEDILDITSFNYLNKPNPSVYRMVLERIGNLSPGECALVEDSPDNLPPARQMGMTTILVGMKSPNQATDYHIPSIYDLPGILDRQA